MREIYNENSMKRIKASRKKRRDDIKKEEAKFWENSFRSNMEGGSGFDDRRGRKKIFQIKKESELKIHKKKVDKPKEIIDNVVVPVPVVDPIRAHLERLRKVCEENPGIKGKQVDITEGFIYCLSNPAWPEWVKVGETIDYESRLKTYQTSSPMTDYKMFLTWWVEDRKMSEREILDSFRASGYEVQGEWVKISQEKLIEFLNK